jgi:hypothetical protein
VIVATAAPADHWSATARRHWQRVNHRAGGLAGDLILYLLSSVFAGITAITSTLAPHRAWGAVAAAGYTTATIVVLLQLTVRRRYAARAQHPADPGSASRTTGPKLTSRTARAWLTGLTSGPKLTGLTARAWLTGLTWATVVAVPLLLQATQRAGGRTDRAQEEVIVIEDGGARLLADGTPYLSHGRIAELPAGDQLLAYLPYQPGMVLFGMPRALIGATWWTDARIWFAAATIAALGVAIVLARRPATYTGDAALIRAAQLSCVLPICALALSTGGTDLPVLALALLALVLCATGRYGAAGAAAGAAAALKLFAWPILIVLLCHAAARSRQAFAQLAVGGVGLPLLVLMPAIAEDSAAVVHNVLGFPLGDGATDTPAASPLPGQLIADRLPGGGFVAGALLLAAGLVIAVHLLRRPPVTAASASLICGVGLLTATVLLPSTRFGYLIYPIAMLAWIPVLRGIRPRTADRPPSVGGSR